MDTPKGSRSVWMASAEIPQFSPLQGDIEAEVCVIGAGIAGLTTAYLLSKQGRPVVLIDAMEVGSGETGRTTAHFFPPDEWYAAIRDAFGAEKARMVANSFAAATGMVESIVRDEGIDCEFERLDGYLYSPTAEAQHGIAQEAAAARAAGVKVEELARVPGLSFDTGPCVQFSGLAQFHPLKYLAGLAQAFQRNGGRLFTQTRALDVKGKKGARVVETAQGNIRAAAVVVATNTPFNDRVVMHTKQAGYRTYVVGMQVPKGSVPRILLWDTGDPYYYIRLANDAPDVDAAHDILIVGGADHKVGQDEHPEHRYAEIEDWVRQRFPMAGEVRYRWSGEVMEPADGMAFLGRNPMDGDDIYIITGDSGNGMTHCTVGAMLVTDLISGRPNQWEELYDPSRKPMHGISVFFKEQANTLSQYSDWLKKGDVEAAREIAAGQGAIVNHAGKKLAVYRDDDGALHALSAACTHLGCVVSWNSAERSWDCPCHASRFNVDGEVLHGPAMKPLAHVALEPDETIPAAVDAAKPGDGKELR